ncbi:MAG TPA: terminase family protein [Burkholderiales bacterium]|nr:terminase family protein [Burkholderiales bacterium]
MDKKITKTWSPPGKVSKAFFESPAEVQIFVGPVGSGKTSTTINKLLTLASLQRPGVDGIRRSRFVITRSTMQRLLSSTLPSFEEWLGGIGTSRRTSPIEKRISAGDIDMHLDFLAIDQIADVDRIMGSNISALVVDEAREIDNLHAILGQLITRCGRYPQGGPSFPTRAILLSNPSDRSHDLYKLAVTDPPEGFETFLAPPAMLPDRITVNPDAENVQNIGASYYHTLRRTMPPDRFAVEVMCEWATLQEGKPLVPEFRANVHVSNSTLIPPRGHPLLIGLDPGNHPAAIVGSRIETESGEVRWEIYAELIGENIVSAKFAAMLREFVERRFPDNPVLELYPDPVVYQPSDRDDERLIAELYQAITKWPLKPLPSNLIDVQLEALRSPFGLLVEGVPAILIDPSCQTLIAALAGRVAYKEAVSGLEKITTDMVIKRHPWHDAFSAAMYLLLGGSRSGGYAAMREVIKDSKKRNRHEGLVWSQRIGKWCDPVTGRPAERGERRVAKGMDYDVLGNG